MKKIVSVVLSLMLLGSIALTAAAFAYPCAFGGCDLMVEYSEFKGFTDIEYTSHKYGGFLGIGQKTCTVATQYSIFHESCAAGHLNNVVKTVYAQSHSSCGQ